MGAVSKGLDRLRRPEYTGENRCLPCTIVNVLIAALLTLGLVLIDLPLVGAAVFLASIGLIYLRGYLVPGTPELTKRYLPTPILRLFGKAPPTGRPGAITGASGQNVGEAPTTEPTSPAVRTGDGSDHPSEHPAFTAALEAHAVETESGPVALDQPQEFLLDADLLVDCDGDDDLCLPDWFESAWADRLGELLEDEPAQLAALAEFIEAPEDALEIEQAGVATLIERDGEHVGNWISRTAFVSDLAAESVLDERFGEWNRIDLRQRSDMLSMLRGFITTCPLCDGDVTFDRHEFGDDDPAGACCYSSEVYTVECADCEERFVEIEQTT